MDKETRNALQNATQRARALLTRDFEEQLEGTYDVLRNGEAAPEGGSHLTARQRTLRPRIVASIEHKQAGGMKPQEAVQDYVRDAAFTTLNRFAALKMLEARGLVLECVSRGDQSSGYAEFTGTAPGVKVLPDGEGYRLFIECIFDELSTEVKVLFDRQDPASALWPRRSTFETLLDVFNAPELSSVWGEDETIGWIYQYFNSGEERRAMREESAAPRNSRELAIRNQFFTPDYVVKFLVENTMGRIWYEMRKGDTRLKESCEYMVRRPGETFASEGEVVPPETPPEGLSQEELWARPVRVPHRPKKDPRSIRAIDPACGSAHFLLSLFDLFVTIYEEGWDDADAPPYEESGRQLRQEFGTIDELRRAIPGLILEHNLHGVDIDPRCTQIAQLALWLRTQRAFEAFGIHRNDRPPVTRSNVVFADKVPNEPALVSDLIEGVSSREWLPRDAPSALSSSMIRTVRDLLRTIWTGMEHAGELGLLVRLDADLRAAIEEGRQEWQRHPLLSRDQAQPRPGEIGSADEFWATAEKLALSLLTGYGQGEGNGCLSIPRRRLFIDDTARGMSLSHIALKSYDVVAMNPPFGAVAASSKSAFEKLYPTSKNDVYAAFVERGITMLTTGGRLGALTSRSGFFLSGLQKWRERTILKEGELVAFADLGAGVLDAAMVEVAAYVLERR